MHSALKKGGQRLYELARKGVEIKREPRPVTVYEIELATWTPPVATVTVHCGSGFYVRSLARDMGELLQCGAHLKSLRRHATGPFRLEDAVSLEDACRSFEDGTWPAVVHAPDVVLGSMRPITLDARLDRFVRNGRPVPEDEAGIAGEPDERARAYGPDGRFLAVMRWSVESSHWRPEKVFAD